MGKITTLRLGRSNAGQALALRWFNSGGTGRRIDWQRSEQVESSLAIAEETYLSLSIFTCCELKKVNKAVTCSGVGFGCLNRLQSVVYSLLYL